MSQTFKGGVHPDYMKAPEIPVTVITPPAQVVIPMAQHIGAPCQPLVKKGDYVTMGQKIGENPAPVSAPVHASVSGKVVAVEPRPHPLGDTIMSIVIENDFQDTPCTDLAPLNEKQLKDPEAILERIRTSIEMDKDLIEAAHSFGASNMQIITKVMLKESLPSLVRGVAITFVNLFGYSAMAGTVGAGGLGDIAIRYGYQRFQGDVMLAAVILCVVLVQVFQTFGDWLARTIDKR